MALYDTTIGALLVGIFLNTFLYGLVAYQFAVYYRTKFDDPPSTKYMVLFLFVLDTFYSVSVIYMAWYYAVANYDNPATLAVTIWPYPFTAMSNSFTALVTQIFLGHRIWRFTESNILYGVVILLAVPPFVLGTVCGIEAWIISVFSEMPRITPIVTAWLTMQVFVDTFITITLIIIFTRSRTGFRRTDTVLNRLTRGAIQTGFFTGIFSICDLISFVVLPTTDLCSTFGIPLGRIYTNTFLDSLLARESLKAELHRSSFGASDVFSEISWPADTKSSQTTLELTSSQLEAQVQNTIQETNIPSVSNLEKGKGKVAPLLV